MKTFLAILLFVLSVVYGYPGQDTLEDSLCGILFNVMGYLHEILKKKSTV